MPPCKSTKRYMKHDNKFETLKIKENNLVNLYELLTSYVTTAPKRPVLSPSGTIFPPFIHPSMCCTPSHNMHPYSSLHSPFLPLNSLTYYIFLTQFMSPKFYWFLVLNLQSCSSHPILDFKGCHSCQNCF